MSKDGSAVNRWARVSEIMLGALEHEGAGRDTWLAQACAGDGALEAEVRSLLTAHEGAGLLPHAPADPPNAASLQRVGPYRILRELGEGGMGTVYLAEREGQDFSQQVALKLIRAGYVDRHLEDRLRSERRILARLEHPGVARFVDGGATPTGQPYVAMEYVDGVPLDAWCTRQTLGVRDRVRLFLDVCDVIQYAHQQLVVHRDLKPGNILVTREGRAKVLDFGIAKVLEEGREPDQEALTAAWITPAYASPEQVSGVSAGTLTDVYALGVILYELLTGQRPYSFPSMAMADVQRVILQTVPERPSSVASDGTAFGVGTSRLQRTLRGDLDIIALKALAKEPERRYASVQQLADDLRRWRDGAPVLARPDTMRYRMAKFARRHRAGVIAGSAGALVLVAGLLATSWQARVAARERDRAETALALSRASLSQSQDVADFLITLFEASAPSQALGDTVAARALLRRGAERVEALAGQPAVQATMLDALGRVHEALGEYERAREYLEQAVAIRRAVLGESHPDVATSINNLGSVRRRQGEYAAGDSLHRVALAIQRASLAPGDPAIAHTLSHLGYVAVSLADLPRGAEYYREALAIFRQGADSAAPVITPTLIALASVVRRQGEFAAAESLYREALEVNARHHGREHPEVAAVEPHLGDLIFRDRPAAAESLFRHAVAVQRAHLRPTDPGRVHALNSLAGVFVARGDLDSALVLLIEVTELNRRTYGPSHPNTAWTMNAIADVYGRQGRFAEADSLYARSLAIQRATLGTPHAAVAGTVFGMAELEMRRGRLDRAESLAREVLTMRRQTFLPNHALIASAHALLGDVLRLRADTAGARAAYRDALAVARSSTAVTEPSIGELEARLESVGGR